jgi:tetratricopeptide (TPR) repeat protein
VYFHQRQYTRALAMYEKAGSVPGWVRVPLGSRKEALHQIGELTSTLARDDRDFYPSWTLARLYTSVGELDSAITWLERAYERRDGMIVYLRGMPDFDPIRDDPRYQALLKKVGLIS